MKYLFLLLLPVGLQAQIQGNFKGNYQQESAGNYQRSMGNANNYDLSGNYNPIVISPVANSAALAGENLMVFNINAMSNQQADAYTAVFSVTQLGKDAIETDNLMNERINSFITAAVATGLPRENFVIDMVSFVPKYEIDVTKKIFRKKTYTEQPVGFQMQKNVHVKMTQAQQLDRLVTLAATQDIYDLVKVDYFVNDPDKIYKEMRDKAILQLEDMKKSYKKIGLNLDSAYIIAAENRGVIYPKNRYPSYQAYSSVSLEAFDKGSITHADKVTTTFYNALMPEGYDIVINPSIVEPAVQYTFSLVVKFTLQERKPYKVTDVKTQKEFILVTPTGTVQTLKVEQFLKDYGLWIGTFTSL